MKIFNWLDLSDCHRDNHGHAVASRQSGAGSQSRILPCPIIGHQFRFCPPDLKVSSRWDGYRLAYGTGYGAA
jgi:hypothetical protein